MDNSKCTKDLAICPFLNEGKYRSAYFEQNITKGYPKNDHHKYYNGEFSHNDMINEQRTFHKNLKSLANVGF